MRVLGAMAVLVALAGAGCRDQRACNDGTVLVTVTLVGRAQGADEIGIQASVDGMAIMGGPVRRPTGENRGSIEVGLGSRYRAGATLILTASARAAGGVLAEQRITQALAPGCTALSVQLGEAPDAGDARDMRDGSPPDVPPADAPPDLLPPSDMRPPDLLPVDLPVDLPGDRPPDLPPDLPPDMMPACPGECIAGTVGPCPRCGMRMCLSNCTWGACMNQGACMPGTTRPCEMCPGVIQTCSMTCGWNACTCPVAAKRIFVTRERHSGNMGGLMGAHGICTRVANAAGLTGTYRAWLSTATSGPANFMTRHPGPYILPAGGGMVATSWADLTDGTLLRPIDRDELGMPVAPASFCSIGDLWTNTTPNGMPASTLDCTGWFVTAGTSQGGNVRFFDTRWTNSMCNMIPCATPLPIYCVEQ